MIKSLTIKNYAIINDITIDIGNGFNVFTGETGAGKSIIIGALSFLSGKRTDSSVIQSGKDKCYIEGIFSIDNTNRELIDKLNENCIDFDDELIVKRVISQDGNNSIRINDSSVTLGLLEDIFGSLIDIHSQRDNHYLFQKKNHIYLLDKYSNLDSKLNEYRKLYDDYVRLKNEYDKLVNETFNETDIEFLSFQLDELEKANLDIDEEKKLNDQELNYKVCEKYINNLKSSISLYNDNGGIKEKLYQIIKELNVDNDKIQKEKSEIENLYYLLDEKFDNIVSIYSSFDASNINIDALEERLYIYSKLKRKYSKTTEELIEYINELKQKLELYKDRDKIIEEKKKELDDTYNKAYAFACEISKIRKQNSEKLSKEVVKETKDLLLNNVQFKVLIKENDISNAGIDDVEFYISLNKGQELKQLKTIVSGGEASRIMLALKIIFTKLSNTKLIVFDEIDAGVSGKEAVAIGQKIALLSKDTKVITITHLAPVAACANNHYYIYKKNTNNVTQTHVQLLNTEQIYQELALIANGEINAQSVKAAKLLYNSCQESIK